MKGPSGRALLWGWWGIVEPWSSFGIPSLEKEEFSLHFPIFCSDELTMVSRHTASYSDVFSSLGFTFNPSDCGRSTSALRTKTWVHTDLSS